MHGCAEGGVFARCQSARDGRLDEVPWLEGLGGVHEGREGGRMIIRLLHAGRVPYAEALALQEELVAARAHGRIEDTLLLLEHPAVLTLGRNTGGGNVLLAEEELRRRDVAVVETKRGGDVTYHGPGQLVGYPIVDLRGDLPGKKGPHLGPVDYVRLLEEVLIRSCAEFGVLGQRICGRTGVWTIAGGSVLEKKIAAIGVHVSRGITSHGFALNVTTDLREFAWIVPCGIADREVTSLEAEIGTDGFPSLKEAADVVARQFGRVFGRQVLAYGSLAELRQDLAGVAAV